MSVFKLRDSKIVRSESALYRDFMGEMISIKDHKFTS